MNATESPTRVNQAALLQWLRWRLFRNSAGIVLGTSFFRALTILLCCVLIWGTLFTVAYMGFLELRYTWKIPLDLFFIRSIFFPSFMALFVLLIFSTGIILYSSLFTSRETAFLLVSPLSADQIFAFKFQGAVTFSSWAFLLLASPIFVAYGLAVGSGAPWYYYLLLLLMFLGFVLIPGSLGALACLLLVNFFPKRRKEVFVLIGLAVVVAISWWIVGSLIPVIQGMGSGGNALVDLLGELSLFQSPFLPPQWMAEGIRFAALGKLEPALYYLALVWSNGLFLYLVTAWIAHKLYRRGHNLLASGINIRRVYRTSWLDCVFAGMVRFLDPQTQVLIQKDFRTFRRDPAQWAQILIFLALATFYFSYIRNFYQQEMGRPFQNGISLLNLTATGFLMCAYTGRFIFPMLSLEGRKFWILGLLPLERSKLLWGKFFFSAICTVLTGEFLVVMSNLFLNMPTHIIVLHAVGVAFLALGMSGLSVGMGATMPNFRENDPSKIAVGLGGTITLLMGMVFEISLIGIMVVPWHLLLAVPNNPESEISTPYGWLALSAMVGTLLAFAAVYFPMRAGCRALEGMEF